MEMIVTYLIGIIGIIGLMVVWVIVQALWRKAFSDQQADDDVLAGRSDCGSCGCTTRCVNKLSGIKK
jgi:hypothetical protein